MFGLTKREQRWKAEQKAEQKAAETLIPMITAIAVEAMRQDDKDAEIAQLRAELGDLPEAQAMLMTQLKDSRAYVERLKQRIDEVMAERDARIKVLEDALRKAIVQNEHDMLMTGEELRAARAALGDKTP